MKKEFKRGFVLFVIVILIISVFGAKKFYEYKREKNRLTIINEVGIQTQVIHKKEFSYMKLHGFDAVYDKGDLIFIYEIEAPLLVSTTIEMFADPDYYANHEDFVIGTISQIIRELNIISLYVDGYTTSDIDFIFSTKLVTKDGRTLLWVDKYSNVRGCIIDYIDESDMGSLDIVGVPNPYSIVEPDGEYPSIFK